ncbi:MULTISPECIES: hypothetical protein [unclassified Enterococcus]|uniref:hypothetical protein n=1 Tax=unclassified Enterococcus TaxID=2608891 RepID=UPI001557B4DB|nr:MULTISPECIES: hypothetical protein [unclassified Enterococcus]MBS7576944.1 hypothetical protein [Enterococcus sp. MMGLQ5-2]MBS7584351.1 hypothetical protein [Enterococcus sp. MMGLQ5-1]NPD12206.1 hypothetical protein [Enterococcus sp. MMGLQ5-1]NPD36778.1 hypothetical protein [Enterococcus sp. MMGLQ5-2]
MKKKRIFLSILFVFFFLFLTACNSTSSTDGDYYRVYENGTRLDDEVTMRIKGNTWYHDYGDGEEEATINFDTKTITANGKSVSFSLDNGIFIFEDGSKETYVKKDSEAYTSIKREMNKK